MLNKTILLLSMTLNLVLALVVLENNNKSLKTSGFRDAVSDTRTTGQLMSNSLGSVIPTPVAQVVATPGTITLAPAQAAAPIKTAALMIKAGNDWAAYKKDAADDNDVFISNIFRSKRRGEKAMAAAVRRNKAGGKNILFSCVLPEKSGGVFYVIRMAPPSAPAPRTLVVSSLKADQAYINQIKNLTYKTETELRETF